MNKWRLSFSKPKLLFIWFNHVIFMKNRVELSIVKKKHLQFLKDHFENMRIALLMPNCRVMPSINSGPKIVDFEIDDLICLQEKMLSNYWRLVLGWVCCLKKPKKFANSNWLNKTLGCQKIPVFKLKIRKYVIPTKHASIKVMKCTTRKIFIEEKNDYF